MNSYANKPMPYGAKVRKVFNKEFYLPKQAMDDLVYLLESESMTKMRHVVEYIEDYGSWLD